MGSLRYPKYILLTTILDACFVGQRRLRYASQMRCRWIHNSVNVLLSQNRTLYSQEPHLWEVIPNSRKMTFPCSSPDKGGKHDNKSGHENNLGYDCVINCFPWRESGVSDPIGCDFRGRCVAGYRRGEGRVRRGCQWLIR